MPAVEAIKAGWAHPEIDILAELTEWFTPLLQEADHMAAGIDGGVRFTCEDADRGDVDVLLDFVKREVRGYAGEKVRYRFRTRRAYVEQLIAEHEIDWVNSLFLSCRFSAHRIGPYNEFIYVFFKCLSEERLNYAEGWFAEQNATEAAETITLDGWDVQRRCPHLKADLSRFGSIDGEVLTCQMHGWKWRLTDGKCLTSVGHDLRSAPAGQPVPGEPVPPVEHHDRHNHHDDEDDDEETRVLSRAGGIRTRTGRHLKPLPPASWATAPWMDTIRRD